MMSPWQYACSCMHCMTVSLALDGEGLGLMWGEQKARTMLAEKLAEHSPEGLHYSMFASGGGEAIDIALKSARHATKRRRLIGLQRCYHGHTDGLLVQAGSGATTFGIPNSGGVPTSYTQQTLSLPFNNLTAVREAFDRYGGRIAAGDLLGVPDLLRSRSLAIWGWSCRHPVFCRACET